MEVSSVHKLLLILQVLLTLLPLLKCTRVQLNYGSDPSPIPPNFLFGTASSAYQYEGAYLTDGKGLNSWDVFTHDSPGDIIDGSNGDVAVDQYRRYQEHINFMASMGINSYQFSISWARILPRGRYGEINSAGIDYYNKLIDALLLKEIQPFVALNHFDIPIELENRDGAWLSRKVVEEFKYLADICFKNFGDRVRYWVTFSEPNMLITLGYLSGVAPPNRCSIPFGHCAQGDSDKTFPLFTCCYIQLNNGSKTFPFPPNFLFGTASSAYQYEGAYLTDGKGLNSWDVFTHNSPGSIVDGSNGDVTIDQYHRYQEHINLMASMGINSYEFSISWARILPRGKYGEVNSAGLDYYNKLIDALLLKGIQPFVVLNHFDIPIVLEHRYGAWLSPNLVEDFRYLADICFKNFGDRVKYWVTFSEPNMMIELGYLAGIAPPNRCSKPFGNCPQGDSEKEPFIAAHNIILAHAAAVKLYKTKYQKEQGGSIGFIVETAWFEPISNSTADKQAAERAQSFFSNWFLDPIISGRYPKEMEDILGPVLPKFSRKDLEDLKLGIDFIGINHYTGSYVKDCLYSSCGPMVSKTTGCFISTFFKDGIPIGEPTGMEPPFYVYPPGLEKIVTYMKERYNNVPMFISENGYCEISNSNSTIEDSVNDAKRVEYFKSYLDSLMTAMRKGADVRGYFLWTLLDSFEWTNGYTKRYGIHHVDHATLKITPKLSAAWYRQFIAEHKTVKASGPEVNPQLSQY